MSSKTLSSPFSAHYSVDMLQQEARQLIEKGAISRQQPIYILCQFIPPREWMCIETELEKEDYLLRDPIADLLGSEIWHDD